MEDRTNKALQSQSQAQYMQSLNSMMRASPGTAAQYTPIPAPVSIEASTNPISTGSTVSQQPVTALPSEPPDLTAFDAASDLQDLPELNMGLAPPPEGTYPDRASLITAVQAHARANGYHVVVKSSSTPNEKKPGRTAKVWLRCDRGGRYRPRNGLTEETRKRKRTSRLLDCPFMLVAAGHPGIWTLTVLNPAHNHGPIDEEPRSASLHKTKKGQVRASPYDWPHDATFTPFLTALVVVDMQRDFCSPNGFLNYHGYDVSRAQAVVRKLKDLLATFRSAGFPIYFTREGHRADLSTLSSRENFRLQNSERRLMIGAEGPLGRFLIRGEPGHEIVEELYPNDNEPVIDKPGKSAFTYTDFELLLRNKGIRNLVFVGVASDLSLSTTMREASDRGFDCVVLEDGTTSTHMNLHLNMIETVKAEGGMLGSVSSVDDMILSVELFKSITAKKLSAPSLPPGSGQMTPPPPQQRQQQQSAMQQTSLMPQMTEQPRLPVRIAPAPPPDPQLGSMSSISGLGGINSLQPGTQQPHTQSQPQQQQQLPQHHHQHRHQHQQQHIQPHQPPPPQQQHHLTDPQLGSSSHLGNPQMVNPQMSNPQMGNPQMHSVTAQLAGGAQLDNAQLGHPQMGGAQLGSAQLDQAQMEALQQ